MSMSGEPSATRKLTLKSSDGKYFEVPEAVGVQSLVIKNMIELDCANDVILLYNVTSEILNKIIDYCSKHSDAIADDCTSEEDLRKWNAEFIDVGQATLLKLIKAAEYLKIKSLFDLTCRTVADMIKGKTPEEIRKTFKIKNDYTPEEEEELRRKYHWL